MSMVPYLFHTESFSQMLGNSWLFLVLKQGSLGQDAACPGGLFTGWLERKLTFPWVTSKCQYLPIFISYSFHVSTGKEPPTAILSYFSSYWNSEKMLGKVVGVLSLISLFIWGWVSCSPDWLGAHNTSKDDLEFFLLPLPLEDWGYRWTPPHLILHGDWSKGLVCARPRPQPLITDFPFVSMTPTTVLLGPCCC